MRRIEQSILSGQNISGNFLTHTYTADIEREIYGQIFVNAITITGASSMYGWMEWQVEGSGSSHVSVPLSEPTMVTGTTVNAVMFTSISIPAYTGDIVKFYIRGKANDTAAYVRTRIFDMDAIRPTVADRTLDIASTGEAGLDFNNIKDASAEHTLANIIVPRTTVITDGYVTVSGTVDAVKGGYVTISGTVTVTDPLLATVPGSYVGGSAGAALGKIGTGQISTVSIVAQSGNVTTYRGDDYNNTDARRIEWTDVSANWPTLTAATILIVVGGDVSFAGTVITATGASKKVGVELTAAQTSTIPQGELDFVVVATLSSGRVVTLVEGKWTSKKQLTVGS